MKYTFGLIGAGNMGGAIARAVSRSLKDGALVDRDPDRAAALAADLGFAAVSQEEAALESRYLFLGVKPHLAAGVLAELAPVLARRAAPPVLVSMAAGVTTGQLSAWAGPEVPVIRIMPNTPVAVGQGVVLYSKNEKVTPDLEEGFRAVMAKAGGLFPIDEAIIDAGTAVSGCGPAFAYLMLDAMADGGVACGLPRGDAVQFAAQTLMGAAQMVLETGKHPAQLKNEVCSPGGSTIQGVRMLEQRSVPAALMDAVIVSYEKSAALGK